MNIILYSNDCPKCKILKQKLDNAKVNYFVCSDVETMKEKGFKAVPMLEIDGMVFDYLSAVNWIKGI